jgi:pimeloyl-ACP methyl ester carboxylesterase
VEPPVAVPVGEGEVTIGRQDVLAFLLGELAEREDYAALPLALHRVAEGGLEPAARSIAAGRRGRRALAMTYAMDCASGASEERWARVRAEAAASWLGEATLSIVPEACDAWPHTDLGPDFRADIESDVPVLFISGSIDARTPAANAEEVAAGFPNGVHMVIEGAGHDDDLFLSSPEILAAMRAFLGGGPVPGRVVLPPLEFATP